MSWRRKYFTPRRGEIVQRKGLFRMDRLLANLFRCSNCQTPMGLARICPRCGQDRMK